jgi:cellulose synthase/poly-beta-1,6-N-acetylglucosamine synthase-like glycosyltransferase
MRQGRFRDAVPVLAAVRAPGDREVRNLLMVSVLSALQDEPAQAPGFAAAPLVADPLVSVVIPTRDRAVMLDDALASVGRQTYARWEAVVVNDGGARVALPAALAARIALIEFPEARGVARARNEALRAAQGEVIAFLDDDDIFLPEHLATLVGALREGGAGFACTRSVGVEERLEHGARVELRRGMPYEYRYSRALLLVRNLIPTANWGVRRECFQRLGSFDETLACAEDWDLLLRLSAATALRSIPAVTAEMRVRPGSHDSVTRRVPLRPTCELLYRRYPSGGNELIELGRRVYLESLE